MVGSIAPDKKQPRAGDCVVWPWPRGTVLLALCAYLLFAHGCHGNEDHELLGSPAGGFVAREDRDE